MERGRGEREDDQERTNVDLSKDGAQVTTSPEGRGAIKPRLPAGGPIVAYGPPGPSRPPSASRGTGCAGP